MRLARVGEADALRAVGHGHVGPQLVAARASVHVDADLTVVVQDDVGVLVAVVVRPVVDAGAPVGIRNEVGDRRDGRRVVPDPDAVLRVVVGHVALEQPHLLLIGRPREASGVRRPEHTHGHRVDHHAAGPRHQREAVVGVVEIALAVQPRMDQRRHGTVVDDVIGGVLLSGTPSCVPPVGRADDVESDGVASGDAVRGVEHEGTVPAVLHDHPVEQRPPRGVAVLVHVDRVPAGLLGDAEPVDLHVCHVLRLVEVHEDDSPAVLSSRLDDHVTIEVHHLGSR